MSSQALEAFLARIYVNPEARARFLSDPSAEAARAGLSEAECAAVRDIDRPGLELAARSIEKKRSRKVHRRGLLQMLRKIR
jgi:hypothetical protein